MGCLLALVAALWTKLLLDKHVNCSHASLYQRKDGQVDAGKHEGEDGGRLVLVRPVVLAQDEVQAEHHGDHQSLHHPRDFGTQHGSGRPYCHVYVWF